MCPFLRSSPKLAQTTNNRPKARHPKSSFRQFLQAHNLKSFGRKFSSALTVAPIIISTVVAVRFSRNSTFSGGSSKTEKMSQNLTNAHTHPYTNIMTRCTWVWAQLSLETMGHHPLPPTLLMCLLSPWMSKQVKGECDEKNERKNLLFSVHFFNGSANTQKKESRAFQNWSKTQRSTGILKR